MDVMTLVQRFVLCCLFTGVLTPLFGQSAADYTATRSTGIAYSSIISSGTSFSWRNGTNTDNNRSDTTAIGFDFWYMGSRYTVFSVSTNGFIDFNYYSTDAGSVGSYSANNTFFFAQALCVAPLYDDLAIPSGGSLADNIKYAVTGSFPNRVLTVEWSNMQYTGNSSPSLNFQVKLYEGTGVIEFVYGTMTAGSASYSYTLGIHDNSATNPPSVSQALVQQSSNSTSFSNGVTDTLSIVPSTNSKITFTPPMAASPTNLTFTSVKWNRMTLNWTDNASNELLYAIYRSDDGGSTYSFIDSVQANGTSYTNYNLSFNTSYQWRVCAVTEGGLNFSVAATQGTNSGLLNGTYTVGPTGTFTTLTDAVADIRTDGVIGPVVFELQSTYTSSGETFPINLLDSSWTSASKTVTIRPASGATGLSISSSSSTGTLRFNKANYFIVDGRPGGTGSSNQLTIENTSTSGFAVEFKNMAGNNTLEYCTVKGVNTSASGGIITFTASAVDDYGVSNTRGNFNTTIASCDIRDGASTPANGIIGAGSASLPDSNTNITNNNIYNFFSTGTNFSYGIDVAGYTQACTISGNSFYQTASRTASSSLTMAAIAVTGSGIPSLVVENNSIGGSSGNAGGGPLTLGPNSQSNNFYGIYVSSSSTVCTIQNNTIRNIALSTNSTDGIYASFCGIVIGAIDTAYISGNTIGSNSGTGSITVDNSANGTVKGIVGSAASASNPGSYLITNNDIGSITCTNTSTSNRTLVYGIQITQTGELATITGNTVGSAWTPNSINYSTSSTVAYMFVRGIDCSHYGSATITNNIVANLNNNSVSTYLAGQTIGIFVNYSVQSSTISGNNIKMLTTTSQDADPSDVNASVLGICNQAQYGISTDSLTISNNTIDSLINTASSAVVRVAGISVSNSSPTFARNVVERNKVTNLLLSTSSTSAAITGIALQGGTATYKNNMVSIGDGLAASYVMTGILDTATTINSYYFNSVRVGGSGVGTDATNTSAFRRAAAGTDVLKDNIFINNRSNASTGGSHYAICVSSTTGLTSDYNDLYVEGTGGVLGRINTTDYTTLANWRTGSGQDAHSVSTTITFVSNTDLHLSGTSRTDAALDGTPISGITTDFDNDTRNATTPMMGADEYVAPLPVELASLTAAADRSNAELRWTTATEVNCAGFEIQREAISGQQSGVNGNNPQLSIENSQWYQVGFVAGAGMSESPKQYSFTDQDLSPGLYSYRLKQIDQSGSYKYSPQVQIEVGNAPETFSLSQNYPNPFNPTTMIEFTLEKDGRVSLKVYDILGREVATLLDENRKAGEYQQAVFDGSRFSSGVYFAVLQSGGKQLMKKMVLIK
jgi:hypothetical protein